jgi:hypothetical protein
LGFNAQKIIVAPELDLVVVFNASRESKNMVSPEIELFDQYILPAALNHSRVTLFPPFRCAHSPAAMGLRRATVAHPAAK